MEKLFFNVMKFVPNSVIEKFNNSVFNLISRFDDDRLEFSMEFALTNTTNIETMPLLLKDKRLRQTEKICRLICEKNGLALEFIEEKYKTKKLYMIAIKENPNSLRFIEKQTKKIVIFAIHNNLLSFVFIDKKYNNYKFFSVEKQHFKNYLKKIYLFYPYIYFSMKKSMSYYIF
jgi:hypothetical protein